MVILSSNKCDTFTYCISSLQKLGLLKILIKMFITTEDDETGLQKIDRSWTGLSLSWFCDGEKPCIVTRIQYSWIPAVLKNSFKDYTQFLHAVIINNNNSTVIQIITDSVHLKLALLLVNKIFWVSQCSSSQTHVYSFIAMIVWKARNSLNKHLHFQENFFENKVLYICSRSLYSQVHETIVSLIKSINKMHNSNNYSSTVIPAKVYSQLKLKQRFLLHVEFHQPKTYSTALETMLVFLWGIFVCANTWKWIQISAAE
jgi:hypothetical protein